MKSILTAIAAIAEATRVTEEIPYVPMPEDDYYSSQSYGYNQGGHQAYDDNFRYGDRYHEDERFHYEEEPLYYGGTEEPNHYYNEPRPQHHDYESQHYDEEYPYYPMEEYDDPDYQYHVPDGAFYRAVDDFNPWETIMSQGEYETRLESEAEIMVSLEALREAVAEINHELDELDDCVDDNIREINSNSYEVHHNTDDVEDVNNWIDDQRYKVNFLQKLSRRQEGVFYEHRDFLILYCQQFAFSPDMVGPCADILTCADTQLDYRWEYWTGYDHHYEPQQHYGGAYDDHHPEPVYRAYNPQPAAHTDDYHDEDELDHDDYYQDDHAQNNYYPDDRAHNQYVEPHQPQGYDFLHSDDFDEHGHSHETGHHEDVHGH